ncbi:MAG: acyl-CoA dehydrogenase family protein, partial [Gammaproteobacteria bacterium]
MRLGDEQRLVRDSVREYVRERVAPFAADWDRDGHFPAEQLREMAGLGLFGMFIPEEWGGSGLDYLSFALAIEEVAAGDGACSTILSVNNSVVCGLLLASGSEYLKQTYLKPLAAGDWLGCFCLTEPQAGSDAAALKTRAVRQGDDYVLDGSKAFITSGKHADIAIVFAVTDPQAGKKGISAFVVPTATPGYEVGTLEQKMGQRASDTAQVFLKNCRVGADHLIGAEGEGYRIALANLEGGRIGIGAQSVGMARAALDCALDYARERESFGKALIEHQAVGFRLADMATRLEAARLMVHNAARLRDAGEP